MGDPTVFGIEQKSESFEPSAVDESRLRKPPPKYPGLRMFRRNKAAVFGAILLIVILFITFVLPLFFDGERTERVGGIHLAPGAEGSTMFGTDYLGRDVGRIVMEGGSATLKVAGLAALVIVGLGTTIGALAGYYGGWVDNVLMRITEFFQVLPGLLFAIVIVALYGASTKTIVLAIGLIAWPTIARLVRAEFLRQKNLEYVKAARAIGANDARIIFKTIMPNTLPVVIVQSTLVMGSAILFEAGLAFLGLSNPKDLSWGFYIGANRNYFLSNWWGVTFPGLMIFFTVLSLSLIGDGLQDAVNPKLRGR
ncbi:MAG: ABC transporter permease [Acidimicrobiaceae bacterium]|jgi:peptide/nickel transport system permease protein|nr:ABC transporter permease [Acidimicrobiaceae bacterium]MBT6446620.1 ABC transporter permease [Acidimicrobiaceae bacterium]MCO4834434.1 ABC transporter permease [Acidimicrobiaceae bacterium]MDB4206137.1 ABC transporter permease [bacterium]MDC1388679.1 ABC transporter permease [Acidimicrobiales bacterium]